MASACVSSIWSHMLSMLSLDCLPWRCNGSPSTRQNVDPRTGARSMLAQLEGVCAARVQLKHRVLTAWIADSNAMNLCTIKPRCERSKFRPTFDDSDVGWVTLSALLCAVVNRSSFHTHPENYVQEHRSGILAQ